MIVVNYGQPARLFRNECDAGNSWLVVRTQGTTGNRDGDRSPHNGRDRAGPRRSGSFPEAPARWARTMMGAHFGLGEESKVDSLTIRWPGGRVQTLTDVPVNQVLRVTEPE